MNGPKLLCVLILVLIGEVARAATMTVHVIDVGQGAATLLEFSCGAVLIDTGGEQGDFNSREKLRDYLDQFFARRDELNGKLDLVVLSHPHTDHMLGVEELLDNSNELTIGGVVDNGQKPGLPLVNRQRRLQRVGRNIGRYLGVSTSTLPATGSLTGGPLDPFDCVDVDPEFRALSGSSVAPPPGWSTGAFNTPNNHSVVLRVDFDEASLLFLGDLQEEGEAALINRYAGTNALDVDYLQASHHGAKNGTGAALLAKVKPKLIFISVGDPARAIGGQTAFGFGHPRKDTMDRFVALQDLDDRDSPVTIEVATGERVFENMTFSKAIYGTGWDGNIRLFINSDGNIESIATD